ncbi:MAG: TRAP transporter substrate-binding protein DctP [Desulfobacterales bacterium]|nr:TRAP transporter substrate-binding protein DctP [Desulfobacterales bacterium]
MKALIAWVFIYVLALGATPAFSLVIKLGTVAPEGSPWHEAMLETAQKWKELSGGRVTLRIYAGGVAGDEKDMLRKIRIGQLHATALTSSTLIDIVPDIEAMSFPMLVRTDGELDYVIKKLGPEFEARLAKKGFKVLTWSTAGWAYFFTKEPVISPADMKKRKLFFWGSDTTYVELLKTSGFNPVPLAITDLLPSLQTGLVDSFAAPPTAALAFQWFALAPHMTDLRWQPLPGTTVVSMRRWNKIPPDLRALLEDVARDVGSRFQKQIRKLDQEAVVAMKKHGLTVHAVPPAVEEEWRTLIREKGYPVFVGPRFSKEMFDTVRNVLDEYRESSKVKAESSKEP